MIKPMIKKKSLIKHSRGKSILLAKKKQNQLALVFSSDILDGKRQRNDVFKVSSKTK